MSFDWHDYIDFADEIISIPTKTPKLSEACYRSAISRYYYGVFDFAQNFLKKNKRWVSPLYISEDETLYSKHQITIHIYRSSHNPIEEKLGKDLSALWDSRKTADYNKNATITSWKVPIAKNLSNQILSNLKKIGAI